jgi:hypothetical protein
MWGQPRSAVRSSLDEFVRRHRQNETFRPIWQL